MSRFLNRSLNRSGRKSNVKMTPEELRTLTLESVAEGSPNGADVTDHSSSSPAVGSQRTPQSSCQVRLKLQESRSIEDLYIDDDFDQGVGVGLGANIELHSDSSDFVNFDVLSDISDNILQ